jgi:hypothetical protein
MDFPSRPFRLSEAEWRFVDLKELCVRLQRLL